MTKSDRRRSRFHKKPLEDHVPVNTTAHRKLHRGQPVGNTTVINNTTSAPADDDTAYQSGLMFRYTAQGIGAAGFMSIPQVINTGVTNAEGQTGTIIGAQLTVETAPTSTASFDLLLNTVSIATFTLTSGDTDSEMIALSTDLNAGDTMILEHTTPQDALGNLVVWVYVSLDDV